MNREELREYRRQNIPIFNDQKLKLGVFAMNCSGGSVITTLPTEHQMSWQQNRRIVQIADRMGLEVALPIGRWKGQGGQSNHNGTNFDVYTWAAGMAEATDRIMCFATSHVGLTHPVVAAKQAATIDHISNGRFGLNVVMGWFRSEMAMFGTGLREHDDRYRYGEEWLDVVKRLWTDREPFDFKSQYFDLAGLESSPKPLQRPGPVLVNAGTSPAGIEFTARNVDISFGSPSRPDDIERLLSVKERADKEYDRDVALMCSALVVCRDTEAEAQAAFQSILDHGDWEAARSMMATLGIESGSFKQGFEERARRFVAGYGTHPLIGTPEQIVDQMNDYARRGVHGLVMYFVDYASELEHFRDRVMPLLKQSGLRH
ncbi:MAG: LLM class flavin-dependent oxidoreductase [Rhizobiales bacterium]|nr:LLM class flavin-dependent oxidoreductase [Hyphomicrobiales bacterium]